MKANLGLLRGTSRPSRVGDSRDRLALGERKKGLVGPPPITPDRLQPPGHEERLAAKAAEVRAELARRNPPAAARARQGWRTWTDEEIDRLGWAAARALRRKDRPARLDVVRALAAALGRSEWSVQRALARYWPEYHVRLGRKRCADLAAAVRHLRDTG